jgi:hypothetical protein
MKKTVLSMPKIYESEPHRIEFMSGLKSVVPDRFVWHIKYANLIQDISIAESGLVKGMFGMVFANSFLTKFHDSYPYCVDSWWELDHIPVAERGSCFNIFSYWRIDTRAFRGQWYVDPNMRNDCASGFAGVPKNYICTDSDIPSYALKNFTFSRKRFENRSPIISSVEGASSYFSLANDFDTLVPNEVINGYMEKYAKNKLGLSLKKVI